MGIFSNYCGLGGSGEVQHELDAICKVHDEDYDIIRKQGANPYFSWNWADQKMMKAWKEISPDSYKKMLLKFGANTFFGIKKAITGSLSNSPGMSYMREDEERDWRVGSIGTNSPNIRRRDPPVLVTPDRPTGRQRTNTEGDAAETRHGYDTIDDVNENMGGEGGGGAMALAAPGAKGRTDGEETGVDFPKYVHMRPFPETNNTIHPYYKRGSMVVANPAVAAAGNTHLLTFRLNSIYDIYFDTAAVAGDDPAPAADTTTDGTINTPMWRSMWADKYRYWTVVRSHYKLKVWTNSTSTNGGQISIWTYHHGQQLPPQYDTPAGANTRIPDYVRKQHKHCHVKKITLPSSTSATATVYTTGTSITGGYKPGPSSVHNEVAEDEFKQTWHKITEPPPLREAVSFFITGSDSAVTGGATADVNVFWEMEIVYQVQWKDLVRKYQYPILTDDLTAVTDTLAQTM